ncbi:MAG: glycosyltransferase family 4 protein [Nitrospirota bacterium]
MKICLDVRYKMESGASSYIKNIVPELLRQDKDNTYTIVKYPYQSFDFEDMAESIIVSPRGGDILQMLWTTFILPIKLKMNRIDIYHGLKNPGPYWNPAKTVFTMHSITDSYRDNYFPVSLKAYIYGVFYSIPTVKHTSRLIAVSNFIKEYTSEYLGIDTKKIDLIYHGINDSFRQLNKDAIDTVLKRYGLPDDYLLCVGNITPVKNHITAVRAFAEISDKISINLVLVGGKDKPYYKELCQGVEKYKLSDRIITPGFIGGDDLVAIMNGARILIFPSLTEGCPVTMLEALKCGLPVVASRRGGLWDVGKECALFVDDPMDYKSFSNEIMKILSSERLEDELIQSSLNRAEEFRWEDTALATLETYIRCYESEK